MKNILICLLIVLLCFNMTACAANGNIQGADNEPTDYEAVDTEPTVEPTPEPPKKITIVAVGDIMFHTPQIKEAYTNNGYDFNPSFEDIKPVIESADIAIGNLETTVNTMRKPSGYPNFNSPVEVLDAIANAGFDVLVTVNNHSVDTGAEGIKETVKNISQKGMIPVGTGEAEQVKYGLMEKNGIKLGILAYTSSTNGIPAPKGMINMLDTESVKKDIAEIRDRCDFLIVYVHMGTEYVRSIEDGQEELFKEIADAGADCVLGSHPHVARKSELYKTNGREVFINYSLGNFISNQNDKYTDIGGMVQLSILKDEDGTKIDGFEILPVYRLRYKEGNKTVRKVVLCSKVEEYSVISEASIQYIKKVSEEIKQLFNRNE